LRSGDAPTGNSVRTLVRIRIATEDAL
jgi:hypothetical protein